MSKNNNVKLQLPILTILGIIFITLKLTGNIDWSWWWVLSPFLIPMFISFTVFLGIFSYAIFSNKK
jgi:hypothetical protein